MSAFSICDLVRLFVFSQLTTVLAFIMVSKVVNDLETIIIRVLWCCALSRICANSALSTLATKCMRMPRLGAACARACTTKRGPKSEPPIPIWITSVMPTHLLHSAAMRCQTSAMAGMTSAPLSCTGVFVRLRRAVWRTARFSLALMASPANILATNPLTSASLALWKRACHSEEWIPW